MGVASHFSYTIAIGTNWLSKRHFLVAVHFNYLIFESSIYWPLFPSPQMCDVSKAYCEELINKYEPSREGRAKYLLGLDGK